MPNNIWDSEIKSEEFFTRIARNGLEIRKPSDINIRPKQAFQVIQNDRVKTKCRDQGNQNVPRDFTSGLNSTKYNIERVKERKINEAMVTIIDVELKCDELVTPWCVCNRN